MDAVYYTNKGGREINEDSLFVTEGAYVVCDGLGGHASGEVASNCAVKVMSELCSENTPYNTELINTFYMRANQAVTDLREKALTTIVGGFLNKGIFYYQGVGDSRLYYFRDGKKFAQTKDDSVCQAAVDLGSMAYEDIRTSEDRSRLLKVLGNDPELKIMRKYDPIPVKKGDAFLVCSDGFWEHVLDEEMEETLRQAYDAEEWLNLMLRIQYSRAKNRDDNYTVICGIAEEKDAAAEEEKIPVSDGIPESPTEKLRDSMETEDLETMPDREVEFEPDSAHVAGGVPFSVPYESGSGFVPRDDQTFKRIEKRPGDATERMPDLSGFTNEAYGENEYYDDGGYQDDEYDDEPRKKGGFFSRLFRR